MSFRLRKQCQLIEMPVFRFLLPNILPNSLSLSGSRRLAPQRISGELTRAHVHGPASDAPQQFYPPFAVPHHERPTPNISGVPGTVFSCDISESNPMVQTLPFCMRCATVVVHETPPVSGALSEGRLLPIPEKVKLCVSPR